MAYRGINDLQVERRQIMLEQLKKFTDNTDLDELLALSAFAKGVTAEYVAYLGEVPRWLTDRVELLDSVIKARVAATLAKAIREAELKLEGYKTAAEKREETLKQLEALRAKKGVVKNV